MNIKEDRIEKSKEFIVGLLVLSISVWLGWQWYFGNGIFTGHALVSGTYGSLASEMVQLFFLLIGQIGVISLGLFRVGIDLLKSVGGFFFSSSGSSNSGVTVNNEFPIDLSKLVNQTNTTVTPVQNTTKQKTKISKTLESSTSNPSSIVLRTDEAGVLYRDIVLEKQLLGPITKEELAQDAVDALVSGDKERLTERFDQLHGA